MSARETAELLLLPRGPLGRQVFSIGQHCCPNWWPVSARGRGDPGKDARRPAAEGEGASDGGMKAAKAGKRHEGCLQNE